jgi:phosphatidylserine decarboxylase
MHKKILFLCSDGLPYITVILSFCLALSFYSFLFPKLTIFTLISWLFFFVIVYFFRDPERPIPFDPQIIVSPADGKVIDIESTNENNFLNQQCSKISIFMSIFSVHVNRAPISGVIEYYQHNPGKFISAFKEKASLDNEQVLVGINSKSEGKPEYRILVKLIAGLIARRIVLWKKMGDRVNKGERISIIKFGSRVEIYLPSEVKLKIKKGDWVKAGETIIGIIS